MAERRMFSKKVVCQPKFRKLPADTQLLYFNLGMRADDDGVVDALEVLEVTKATVGNLELLEKTGYIKILDEDLITYIVHWKKNNYIRGDRYTPSEYKNLIPAFLSETTNRKPDDYADYPTAPEPVPPTPDPSPVVSQRSTDGLPVVSQRSTDGLPVVSQRSTQVRLGKDRLDEISLDQFSLGQVTDCSAPVVTAVEPPVIDLPTNKKGESFPVMSRDVEEWSEAYPAVDVNQQLRAMRSWLDANPAKRKTYRGMKTFVVNWLSREQNRGGARAGGGQRQQRKVPNYPAPYREPTPEELARQEAESEKNNCSMIRLLFDMRLEGETGYNSLSNYPVPPGMCGGRAGKRCCNPDIECPMKKYYTADVFKQA